MSPIIECKTQLELDALVAEHGEQLRVKLTGNWSRVVVKKPIRSIGVSGTVEGSIDVYGWKCSGDRYADAFAAGPMLELLDACPGGRAAAVGAWGKKSWSNCPLHDALGIGEGESASFKDVDRIITSKRLRLFARMFVSLHDEGRIQPPQIAACPPPLPHRKRA